MTNSALRGGTGDTQMMQITDLVVVKLFCTQVPTTNLKAVLEKVKGVTNVQVDERAKEVRCNFTGKIKDVQNVEKGCANAGVCGTTISHARMILAFKPQKGADVAKLRDAVQKLGGVKAADVQAAAAEVYADLQTFNFEDLAKACEGAGFTVECKTHERVDLSFLTDGATTDLELGLKDTRGVLICRVYSDKSEMLTVKKVSDDTFKKVCEKTKVKFVKVDRK